MSFFAPTKPPYLIVILALLLLFSAAAINRQPRTFYPTVTFEVPDPNGNLRLEFVFDSRPSLENCEMALGSVARQTTKNCPACSARQLSCERQLEADQQLALSDSALDVASGRMRNGVVIYRSANSELAQAACRASEQKSVGRGVRFKCFAAGSERPYFGEAVHTNFGLGALMLFVFAALASGLTAWLILKYEHLHAHISHDHVDAGPQKYHEHPTPRIGGVAVMLGLLAAFSIPVVSGFLFRTGDIFALGDMRFLAESFGLLLLASTPAFFGGLVEDVTKRVGVTERLFLTMLAGSCAAWLLGAVLQRLDVPGIDIALAWYPFAIMFTAFAVGGIANAINIIDGYNGLAGGFSIIVLLGLAFVGYQEDDLLVLSVSLALAGALLGFFVWNWPGGQLFLGDGGAYLTGFMLAELSILLVARNPGVSPWFPLALLIYPVFETFYSIYRRKFGKGVSFGQPDNQHLHQLIHDYLVPSETKRGVTLSQLETNSRVAKYFWAPATVMTVVAAFVYASTPMLVVATLGFCVFYVVNYRRIEKMACRSQETEADSTAPKVG